MESKYVHIRQQLRDFLDWIPRMSLSLRKVLIRKCGNIQQFKSIYKSYKLEVFHKKRYRSWNMKPTNKLKICHHKPKSGLWPKIDLGLKGTLHQFWKGNIFFFPYWEDKHPRRIFFSEFPERSYGQNKVAPTRPGHVGAQKWRFFPF